MPSASRAVPALLLLLSCALLSPAGAFAHPGRTADDGCHYCRTNCDEHDVPWNERHCHGGGTTGGYKRLFSDPEPTPNRFLGETGDADDVETAAVVEVIDGDTIKVTVAGATRNVRLIGIDTPETVHPSEPVECFGREASARLSELLPVDTVVALELDAIGDTIDKYDRLLRYVKKDGVDVNAQLVEEGYAYAYTTYPFERSSEYVALEASAREAERGLWAPGVCDVPAASGSVGSAETASNPPTADRLAAEPIAVDTSVAPKPSPAHTLGSLIPSMLVLAVVGAGLGFPIWLGLRNARRRREKRERETRVKDQGVREVEP